MAEAVRILFLDCATRTGWCAGAGTQLPEVGHIDLPPPVQGRRGPMFSTFRRWLWGKLISLQAPGVRIVLGFEQPILPKPFVKRGQVIWPVKIETTLILQGLVAIAQECAETMGVEYLNVDVSTIKRELAGHGGAGKDDMVYVARKVGLTIAVHDEADAFAGWLVALRRFNPTASREFDRLVWSQRGAML